MRLGIDLGGTKIEIVALDAGGTIRHRRRAPTPQGDYAATLSTMRALVDDAEARLGLATPIPVGVGIPGSVSPATGLIQNANSTCLIGQDLAGDLAALLARPVRLANDADCFTLSEATDGAGAGAPLVFGVILGTGVGGGIAFNRQLLAGPNAIAGEWGHNALPWPQAGELPGPTCYCGRRGCIETFLSGPGLSRAYREAGGLSCQPDEIERRAKTGDATARAVLTGHAERLARALAMVINILDPHVVVLGGGLSNLEELYAEVPRLWRPHVFANHPRTRLVQARHGDSSGVRGAAWLWPGGWTG
ncbi:Fructokinase [Candidatus Magnetaquicoccaceae bacterium FCR-1]|uniref:Fructokinase n=1 Tax=Candidatus Magnetaquiglobus chichijimensis TaxID=3141448 RepID=A0ABQ0CAD3_9PROT